MKRLSLLLSVLLALILTGCTVSDLARYPYISQERRLSHANLTLAVPQEEWMVALGGQLTELVSSYSDGTIKLQLIPAEEPLELYRTGEAELVLCTSKELSGMAPEFAWLSLPFLFPTPESYLAALNAPAGPVRGRRVVTEQAAPENPAKEPKTEKKITGELLGGYYDSGWMMATDPYGEALLYGELFGVHHLFPDRSLFLTLGARDTASGNAKKLRQLLEQGETGSIEFWPESPEGELPTVGALLCSRHRMEGRFLILRDNAVEGDVRDCLLQAVSETATQAARQRMESEEETLALLGPVADDDRKRELSRLFERMQQNYLFSPASYGIPEEAMDFLRPILE